MSKLFAFFDVDCRHPDPLNSEFVAAKTTEPIGDILNKIYSKAQQLDAPVLALTCLSILRHNPGMSVKDTVARQNQTSGKKMAFISLKASPKEIEKAVACRQIFIERRGYKSGQENVQQSAMDVFRHNINASQIVTRLGNRHWLVFGRGFRYCVVSTVVGLLALRQKVTVLTDATMAAACNQTENDTKSDEFIRNVNYLKSLGAEFADFESVFVENI